METESKSEDETEEVDEEEPNISVEVIDNYENVIISDWLSDNTVIVSKENDSLDKMKLEELSASYPRSLYLFNIDKEEYNLLKEEENLFLGDATLSPDKKHLLYTAYILGDPTYSVMNIDTLEGFEIHADNIGAAYSAEWADKDTVIGASYSGGTYLASTTGEIELLDLLKDETIFIVRKMKDKIYYNTSSDATIMVYDQSTKETTSLNIENVYRVLPSPNENQIAILQDKGSTKSLLLYDADGDTVKTITEGDEISGISWSPNQRMIAYSKVDIDNGSSLSSIYLYDIMMSETTKIVDDVEYPSTNWSPSGNKLAYTEWDGEENSSSIVHLKFLFNE